MKTVVSFAVAASCALLAPTSAKANCNSDPDPAPALVPRAPTGFSTIEQRYVYGTPEEGMIEFPLQMGVNPANEVVIEEPSMCNGGSAVVRFVYSKSNNTVRFEATFKGLPYRMSYTRPDDPSTPWNQFPTSVTNGVWQIWLGGKLFNRYSNFYYDVVTGDLLGNEFDLAKNGGIPTNAIPVSLPGLQMIETPLFEGQPNGDAYLRVDYAYDNMIDDIGTGGTIQAYVPKKLCKPDDLTTYYTNGGIPASEHLTFDDFLDTIHGGYGIMVAVSLEPRVKPAYLAARDNIMVAYSTVWPGMEFDGKAYTFDTITGVFSARTTPCGTHIAPPIPPGYYNFCTP